MGCYSSGFADPDVMAECRGHHETGQNLISRSNQELSTRPSESGNIAPGITDEQARAQLPRDLVEPSGKSIYEQWLAARGAASPKATSLVLGMYSLDRLTTDLRDYRQRLAAEEQIAQAPTQPPIADINQTLSSSKEVGPVIVGKRQTGVSVNAVKLLRDAEFFQAYAEDQWAAYKAGTRKFSALAELEGKVPERALKTFLTLCTVRSSEGISGFTGVDRTVYLRLTAASPHSYIHEAMHVYSDRNFKGTFDKDIDEGVTELWASILVREFSYTQEAHYLDEVELVLDFAEICGIKRPAFLDAYFNGNVQPVVNAIKEKLGENDFNRLIQAGSVAGSRAVLTPYKNRS